MESKLTNKLGFSQTISNNILNAKEANETKVFKEILNNHNNISIKQTFIW